MLDETSEILRGSPQAIEDFRRRTDERLAAAMLDLKTPYTGDGIEYLDKALPYLPKRADSFDFEMFENPGDSVLMFQARNVLTKHYAWAIPSEAALAAIAKLSPIVEVGAGSGYWAKELRKLGAKVAPYDRDPYPLFNGQISFSHSAVSKGGAEVAMRKFPERTLFLCWPSYSLPWAARAVRMHRGEYVAYIGEGLGGCTGDDDLHFLFGLLYEEIDHLAIPQWFGLHDSLTIYRRTRAYDQDVEVELQIALHAYADRWNFDDDDDES